MEYTEEEKDNFIIVIDYYDSYCKENSLTSDEYSLDDFINDGEYKGSGVHLTTNEKIQIIKYYNSSHSSPSHSSSSHSSSSHSSSSQPFILSTHTLLLNCCHGQLPVVNERNHKMVLDYIYNPIQTLNRLIEGAQICITSHHRNDDISIMQQLKEKNWDSLNSVNIQEAKKIIQNINGYKTKTIRPKEHEYYYDYLARNNQFHNTLQFITNTIDEKIINKIWMVETRKEKQNPSGIYFVNKTTFIVPKMNKPYVKSDFIEYFNYETNQITYTIFDNILTCPIFKQYNNYCFEYKVPQQKSWKYNIHSNTFEYEDMISTTNAYALYNYLANIPNVSMIDTSCESHELNEEVNKLKELRDSYRKLGPRVGKKLVKQITKKIYRLEHKLRSKARGKHKKKNTRKRNTRKK